jgi:uncharacterized membrane protein
VDVLFSLAARHERRDVDRPSLVLQFRPDPVDAEDPDEQKPAITKVIAPAALFWFRWGALATVVTGLILAYLSGYLVNALKLGIGDGNHKFTAIGFGMWMGLIMAFNVWFIIWPNQQKVLGLVEATADEKKRAGRVALLASRTNTMLSIPMLYAMTSTHFY